MIEWYHPPKPLKPLILHFQTKPKMITIYKLCPVIVAIVLWQVDTTDFHIWHLFIELFHANSSLACITEWHIVEKVSLLSNESLIMTHLNIEIAMTYWKNGSFLYFYATFWKLGGSILYFYASFWKLESRRVSIIHKLSTFDIVMLKTVNCLVSV